MRLGYWKVRSASLPPCNGPSGEGAVSRLSNESQHHESHPGDRCCFWTFVLRLYLGTFGGIIMIGRAFLGIKSEAFSIFGCKVRSYRGISAALLKAFLNCLQGPMMIGEREWTKRGRLSLAQLLTTGFRTVPRLATGGLGGQLLLGAQPGPLSGQIQRLHQRQLL